LLPVSQILIISALSGLLGLDATAALQVMVSRPLVVGGVVGWLMGDVATGLTVGSLVEMLWIGGVPVGSLVPPDGTQAATFAAVAVIRLKAASAFPGAAEAAGALGVIAAVAVGGLGARAEIIQRRMMAGLSRLAEREVDAGDPAALGRILLGALGLAWLRGALVCAASLAVGLPLLGSLLGHLPSEAVKALDWCFWLFWLLGLAVVADHFWERRALKHVAVGALGLAVLGSSAVRLSQASLLLAAVALAHLAGVWRWMRARRGEAA
jgi:mannose/fructose/N-acetylgalactosamine-specific phosphotransferase system component IIC